MFPEHIKLEVDVLMKKYGFLREEIMFYLRTAKLHTKYFQAFFGGSLLIVWYLFFYAEKKRFDEVLAAIQVIPSELFAFVMLATNITAYYFAFDLLDCYFCVFVAGARLANIEDQINEKSRATLLIWETMYIEQKEIAFGWSRRMITGMQIMLVVFTAFLFPLFCYWQIFVLTPLSLRSDRLLILLGAGSVLCVVLFLMFAIIFVKVFITKRHEPRRVISEIWQGKRERPDQMKKKSRWTWWVNLRKRRFLTKNSGL